MGVTAVLFCLVAAPLAADGSAMDAGLEALTLLALAPHDGRAVIQLPGGELRVIAPGDELPGTAARVVEVLADRLVVAEELSGEPPVRLRAWIFRPESPGASSRVRYLDPRRPRGPPALLPGPGAPLATPTRELAAGDPEWTVRRSEPPGSSPAPADEADPEREAVEGEPP